MKDNSANIKKILEVIENNQTFVLTSHINPDGDGLGSELALYRALTNMGKEVRVINHSPIPESLGFLDPGNVIFEQFNDNHSDVIANVDVIFVLDISILSRLGKVAMHVDRSKALKVCIDHHATNALEADFLLIDEYAVATGELVYDLLSTGNYNITQDIAEGMYIAIMSDTGNFKFSNTNGKCLAVCSKLLQTGIDHHSIYRKIYEKNPWRKVRLFSRMLDTLKSACADQIAYMTVTTEMFESTGSSYEDLEGFADYPRNIDGVLVAILFSEMDNGNIKVSLRSAGKIHIDGVASEFGGGGHKNAAAAVLDNASMENAVKMVINSTENYLDSI